MGSASSQLNASQISEPATTQSAFSTRKGESEAVVTDAVQIARSQLLAESSVSQVQQRVCASIHGQAPTDDHFLDALRIPETQCAVMHQKSGKERGGKENWLNSDREQRGERAQKEERDKENKSGPKKQSLPNTALSDALSKNPVDNQGSLGVRANPAMTIDKEGRNKNALEEEQKREEDNKKKRAREESRFEAQGPSSVTKRAKINASKFAYPSAPLQRPNLMKGVAVSSTPSSKHQRAQVGSSKEIQDAGLPVRPSHHSLKLDESKPYDSRTNDRAKHVDGPSEFTSTPKSQKRRRESPGSLEVNSHHLGLPGSGPFVKAEKDIIDEAINEFIKAAEISKAELNDIVQAPLGRVPHSSDLWTFLVRKLPNRTHVSIMKYCRRNYHNAQAKGGNWTLEEDQQLRELVAVMPNRWKDICVTLGRRPDDCRDRWRNYVKYSSSQRVVSYWTSEEEERLLEIIDEKLTQLLNDHNKAFGHLQQKAKEDFTSQLNWGIIADAFGGTRSRLQCSQKWKQLQNSHGINNTNDSRTKRRSSQAGLSESSNVDQDSGALERTSKKSMAKRKAGLEQSNEGNTVDSFNSLFAKPPSSTARTGRVRSISENRSSAGLIDNASSPSKRKVKKPYLSDERIINSDTDSEPVNDEKDITSPPTSKMVGKKSRPGDQIPEHDIASSENSSSDESSTEDSSPDDDSSEENSSESSDQSLAESGPGAERSGSEDSSSESDRDKAQARIIQSKPVVSSSMPLGKHGNDGNEDSTDTTSLGESSENESSGEDSSEEDSSEEDSSKEDVSEEDSSEGDSSG